MKKITLGNSNLKVPAVAIGCMRLTELQSEREVEEYIQFCLDNGANFFDHADIYCLVHYLYHYKDKSR